MSSLDYVPFALACLGALVGFALWEAETVAIGLGTGYFLGKLAQSIVWTVAGPPTSA